jgi:hypothetical protein
MIDLNDHASVCRSIGYFIQYLGIITPILALAWITWRVAR